MFDTRSLLVLLMVWPLMLTGCMSYSPSGITYMFVNHRDQYVRDVYLASDNDQYYQQLTVAPRSGSGSVLTEYHWVPKIITLRWTEDHGWDEHRLEQVLDVSRPLPGLIRRKGYDTTKYTLIFHFYEQDVQLDVVGDSFGPTLYEKDSVNRVQELPLERARRLWVRTVTIPDQSYRVQLENREGYDLHTVSASDGIGGHTDFERIDAKSRLEAVSFGPNMIPHELTVKWKARIGGEEHVFKKELTIPRPLPELEPGQWFGQIKSPNWYRIGLVMENNDVVLKQVEAIDAETSEPRQP